MATVAADPLLDSLVNDFGGNYVFALDVLEQYRLDRQSVDRSWREYFDRLSGVTPQDDAVRPAQTSQAASAPPSSAPAEPAPATQPTAAEPTPTSAPTAPSAARSQQAA